MEQHDLNKIYDHLIDIAKEAGEMITSATPSSASSGSKKNCAFSGYPRVIFTPKMPCEISRNFAICCKTVGRPG